MGISFFEGFSPYDVFTSSTIIKKTKKQWGCEIWDCRVLGMRERASSPVIGFVKKTSKDWRCLRQGRGQMKRRNCWDFVVNVKGTSNGNVFARSISYSNLFFPSGSLGFVVNLGL